MADLYRTRLGTMIPITPGALDDNAVTLFMEGQCHALAMAVALRQGWNVGIVNRYDASGALVSTPHVVVALPDGRFADIDDVYNDQDIAARWGDTDEYVAVDVTCPELLLNQLSESWAEPQLVLADSFVEQLVAEWGFALRPQLSEDHASRSAPQHDSKHGFSF